MEADNKAAAAEPAVAEDAVEKEKSAVKVEKSPEARREVHQKGDAAYHLEMLKQVESSEHAEQPVGTTLVQPMEENEAPLQGSVPLVENVGDEQAGGN